MNTNQQTPGTEPLCRVEPIGPDIDSNSLELLSLLMCDLVDSTAISENLSPIEMGEFLTSYYEIADRVFRTHNGRLIRCVGDGVYAIFENTFGVRESAINAARAAIDLQKEISDSPEIFEFTNQIHAVRISVVTGVGIKSYLELVRQEVVFGELPFLADRLKSLAKPNDIVFNRQSADLIGSRLNLIKMDGPKLRGFRRKVKVWRLNHKHREEFSTPFFEILRRRFSPLASVKM